MSSLGTMAWDFTKNNPASQLTRLWLATLIRAVMTRDITQFRSVLQAISAARLGDGNQGGSPDPNQPLWGVARYPDNLTLIVLGGTYTPQQWYSHLAGFQMRSGPWPGKVHSYWAQTAAALAANIGGALGPLPGQRFFLTGHSWGGACAQILCYLLAQQYPGSTFQTVTFGSPKVGNQAFADAFDSYLGEEHVVRDPVVVLPPSVSATTKFLFLGAASFLFPNTYARAGVMSWNTGGPQQLTRGFNYYDHENLALVDLLTNSQFVRCHALYYYALTFFRQCKLNANLRGATWALDLGYDLADLQTLNANFSQSEGLVTNPAFPVPIPNEP